MARAFNIFMGKTIVFLFIAFGDFKKQMEMFSSFLECLTLGQEQTGFFLVPFFHLTSVKVFKYHITDLAINEETVPNKMKLKNLKKK